MNNLLGHGAAVAALVLCVLGCALAFWSAGSRNDTLRRASGDLAYGVLAFAAVTFVVMEVALVTHDFSVEYVAQVGSRSTPLVFTVASLWSALEGSILLWALILAGYTAAFVIWTRRREDGDEAIWIHARGTLLVVNIFFFLLIAGPANPFESVYPVPDDGPGPNPLLQNNLFMAVHPPILYMGYVGLSVPFAVAMGGVLAGRIDRTWSRAIRSWTLVPWTFLTVGILAGAWWSYEVLGWGGYWAWDPVENASFMPWLVATAFLHSLMVQERREMLKTWTISLIVAAFILTLLGTFLTRSGVLASVHAFTEGLIGPFFLVFMAVVAVASLGILAWRADLLSTEGRLESAVSRETVFLLNNTLFAAFTIAVLVGTLFPLVVEAIEGERVTVGGPFFNQTTTPIALALVFLAGVGPALPWGRGDPERIRRKFGWPTALALVVGAVLWIVGVREVLALLTFVLAVFSAGLLAAEIAIPTRGRRRAHGEPWMRALANLFLSNRRRYGGYVVHFGVLVLAVGIAASSSFRQEAEWTLELGERGVIADYSVQLDSVWAVEEPQRDAVVAGVTIGRGRETIDRFFPRLNYYPNSAEPVGTPAIREHPSEDLYLVLAQYADDGSHATIQAIISPLVWWIWIGGGIMGLGSLFALWPGAPRRLGGGRAAGEGGAAPDRDERAA